MQLYITRNQEEQKGFFGGSKGFSFLLTCRVKLNEGEISLVEKYKQWDIPIYSYQTVSNTTGTWSLRGITEGKTLSCAGVMELLGSEEQIKEACQNLKILLGVMATFGGEEIVEF